ncbi:MAG: LapA family protein [Planctomycetota bacterium]
MQKIRWILLILAILAALTVTLQNTTAVSVRLLWIDLSMSLSILLACTTAIGFLAGALTTALMLLRRGGEKKASKPDKIAKESGT